jgi:hypothetical protein
MKLIADTVLTHRSKTGQSYLVEVGKEFEIDDASGQTLIDAGEAHEPAKRRAGAGDPVRNLSPTEFAARFVEQPAEKIIAAIGEIEDPDLLRIIGETEAAGKNRSTVLAAVLERGTLLTTPKK